MTIHQLKDRKWTQVIAGAPAGGGDELEPGWVGNVLWVMAELAE